MRARGVFCALAVALVVAAPAARGRQSADDALIKKARAIHDKAITLDTHVDINPSGFTAERNYTQRLDTQVNLPKMVEGGLDAVFLIVYVGQPSLQSTPDAFEPAGYERAYKAAIEKFDAVHRLTETIAPDKIGLALTAADVRRIAASGRKVALIGVENGYPLGTSISRVQEFYDRGGRYMSLAHNGHSQLSDSNTGETEGWKWNGLSPLGKQVIAEMNRVGIMIDVSHPSKAIDDAGAADLQGADHRLALGGPRVVQPQPEPGRRAAARVEEERRRGADRGVRDLRQERGHARAARRTGRPAQGVRPAAGHAPRRPGRTRRPGPRRRARGHRSGARCHTPAERRPAPRPQRQPRRPGPRRRRARAVERGAPGRARQAGGRDQHHSTRRSPARRSRTSSITSTTSSRRSASTMSGSRPTSTAAAASTAGTMPARRST